MTRLRRFAGIGVLVLFNFLGLWLLDPAADGWRVILGLCSIVTGVVIYQAVTS